MNTAQEMKKIINRTRWGLIALTTLCYGGWIYLLVSGFIWHVNGTAWLFLSLISGLLVGYIAYASIRRMWRTLTTHKVTIPATPKNMDRYYSIAGVKPMGVIALLYARHCITLQQKAGPTEKSPILRTVTVDMNALRRDLPCTMPDLCKRLYRALAKQASGKRGHLVFPLNTFVSSLAGILQPNKSFSRPFASCSNAYEKRLRASCIDITLLSVMLVLFVDLLLGTKFLLSHQQGQLNIILFFAIIVAFPVSYFAAKSVIRLSINYHCDAGVCFEDASKKYPKLAPDLLGKHRLTDDERCRLMYWLIAGKLQQVVDMRGHTDAEKELLSSMQKFLRNRVTYYTAHNYQEAVSRYDTDMDQFLDLTNRFAHTASDSDMWVFNLAYLCHQTPTRPAYKQPVVVDWNSCASCGDWTE